MLEMTRELILGKYNMYQGYDHDAKVVYGDTDSVMVLFGNDNMKEVFEMGKEAC